MGSVEREAPNEFSEDRQQLRKDFSRFLNARSACKIMDFSTKDDAVTNSLYELPPQETTVAPPRLLLINSSAQRKAQNFTAKGLKVVSEVTHRMSVIADIACTLYPR